jgi:hypothetical protein
MARSFEVPSKLAALTEKAEPSAGAKKYIAQLDVAMQHLEAADKELIALGDAAESDDSAEEALPMIDDALDKLVRVRSIVTRTRHKFR